MKFGRVAAGAAEGLILAHAVRAAGVDFKKGEVVGARHVAALERAGIASVIGAVLEPGDVAENIAALELAKHVAGANIRLERAFTGRCNLISDVAGLVHVDAAAIDAINAIDESVTLATLPPFQPVEAGEMVATVKIIPFAVSGAFLSRSMAVDAGAVRIAKYLPLRVGVVSTLLPGLKASTVAKTLHILEARLSAAGASIVQDIQVVHDALSLAESHTGHGRSRSRDRVRCLGHHGSPRCRPSGNRAGGRQDRTPRHARRSRQPASSRPSRSWGAPRCRWSERRVARVRRRRTASISYCAVFSPVSLSAAAIFAVWASAAF